MTLFNKLYPTCGSLLTKREGGVMAPPKVPEHVIVELMDEGLAHAEIARRVGLSQQAVTERIGRIRARDGDAPAKDRLLPWTVKGPHRTGNMLYQALLHYAHWRRGDRLTPSQYRQAKELEDLLTDVSRFPPNGAVMLYDPRRGFVVRNRRPGDGPEILVPA